MGVFLSPRNTVANTMKRLIASIFLLITVSPASALEAFKAPDGSVVIIDNQSNVTQEIEYTNLNPKKRIRSNTCGIIQVRDSADFPLSGAVLKIGSQTIQVDALRTQEKPRCRDGKVISQPGD